MSVTREIPSILRVAGFDCRVWYAGQPSVCPICRKPGHRVWPGEVPSLPSKRKPCECTVRPRQSKLFSPFESACVGVHFLAKVVPPPLALAPSLRWPSPRRGLIHVSSIPTEKFGKINFNGRRFVLWSGPRSPRVPLPRLVRKQPPQSLSLLQSLSWASLSPRRVDMRAFLRRPVRLLQPTRAFGFPGRGITWLVGQCNYQNGCRLRSGVPLTYSSGNFAIDVC